MLGLGLGLHRNSFKPRGILESYKSSVVAGFSYYQLFSSSKNCVEVRRSSDNATQVFGYKNGYIDSASILVFCGAGSGYVKTWYNQFLQGNNAIQVVSGNQPRIVNNGVFEGNGLFFDSVNDYMPIIDYSEVNIIIPFLGLYSNAYNIGGTTYLLCKNQIDSGLGNVQYYILHRSSGLSGLQVTNVTAQPQSAQGLQIKTILNWESYNIDGLKGYNYYNETEYSNFNTKSSPALSFPNLYIGARNNSGVNVTAFYNGYIKTIVISNNAIPNNILRKV